MRRKKIIISLDELPNKPKKSLVSFIDKKWVNIDPKTITITAYEQYQYSPKTYELLIKRLKRYVDINGNKTVWVTDLSAISKISRPTINKMRKYGLIPSDADFKRMKYKALVEEKKYNEARAIQIDFGDVRSYNLQEIVNYYNTLHSTQKV